MLTYMTDGPSEGQRNKGIGMLLAKVVVNVWLREDLKIFIQSLCNTCSTTLTKSSNLYHLSLKPYSYKQSCNSVCISKLASMSGNHIMKRCIAEFHALRHKTPLNTCILLSKLTRILSGVYWKL